ncbi:hypothetical protein SAMN05216436_105215 [bacterium A37T11]|nr:hypothetical protein SAMN05216436_105215 [bacterium A37T11]
MAKKAKAGVGFKIRKIATEQFAVLEENFVEGEKVRLNNGFRFGVHKTDHIIVVFANFKFEIQKKPFLLIEAGCYFAINAESWKEFLSDEEKKLTIPKNLLSHLATLSVGTARGILHAKTENTPFNKYFIPSINVAEMINEDIVFEV